MNILSTPRVYFHIDEPGRDAITAAALKNRLQDKNIKLVYGNRRLTSALFRFSLISAFDIVIVPRPMFIPHSFNGHAGNGHAGKVQIMVLPTESIGRLTSVKDVRLAPFYILDREYMEGDTSQVDQVDRFLLWSESNRNSIISLFPSLAGKLSVVGHPRFDELVAPPLAGDSLSSDHPVKRVGLITRFPLLNDFDGRSVIEAIVKEAIITDRSENHQYHNLSTNEVLSTQNASQIDELYKQASDIFVLTTIMSRLTQLGVAIDLKIHPRESYASWVGLLTRLELSSSVRLVDHNIPFPTWARGMDYVIGPASTSYFECVNLGVTPICIKNIDKKRAAHLGPNDEEDTDLIKAIFCPSSVDELVNYVVQGEKQVLTDDILRILNRETMYPEAKLSLSRVSGECDLALRDRRRHNPSLKLGFYLLFLLFNKLYNARVKFRPSRFRKIREGSSFILDRRATAFVDSLLDIPNRVTE